MQAKRYQRACIHVNSDMTPPAQTVEKFKTENELFMALECAKIENIIKNNSANAFGAVLELLYLYGLRISEVLSISGFDVKPDNSIKVRLSKGGTFRVVYPVVCGSYWRSFSGYSGQLQLIFSRFYFYREFKKHGIECIFGSNVSTSVTHSLRHFRVLSMISNGFTQSEVSEFLGHKSLKSLQFYVKPKRQ